MKPVAPPWIAVSGLTGAGKSTLTRSLGARLGYEAFVEDVSSNPYLATFFTQPQRFAFPLQMWFLQYRYHQSQRAQRLLREGQIRGAIFDRTLWDGLAFVRALSQVRRLDPLEAQTYYQVFQIASQNAVPPAAVIYLDCSAEGARQRILKRGTVDEDKSLTLDYLEILRLEYSRLIDEWRQRGIRIITLNGDLFHDPSQVAAALIRPNPEAALAAP